MPDPAPSRLLKLAEQRTSRVKRAAVVKAAQQTRTAADEAMTAATRCGAVAQRLGLHIRSTAGFLAHRSTRELRSDAPVVTALATGHTALLTAEVAAEDATAAAAGAAGAAMAIELELESLPAT